MVLAFIIVLWPLFFLDFLLRNKLVKGIRSTSTCIKVLKASRDHAMLTVGVFLRRRILGENSFVGIDVLVNQHLIPLAHRNHLFIPDFDAEAVELRNKRFHNFTGIFWEKFWTKIGCLIQSDVEFFEIFVKVLFFVKIAEHIETSSSAVLDKFFASNVSKQLFQNV
jgi:hypothetical protein